MKRTLIIIVLFALTNIIAKAQSVKFRSPVIESYIKSHVGIGQADELNTGQLDTITYVDLSGLDLTDISDVKFLTNVRSLDLSNNKIENIAPLATLDSLCEVNLSHNNLKSLSMLSFSYAKKMYVNIAFNYINDFSCFNTLTNCYFTIAGANVQYDNEASFFDVDYLVCNNKNSKPVVTCRVNSNSSARTTLKFQDEEFEVPTDRSQFKCELSSDIASVSPIYLTNGEDVYSTYIVPIDYYGVDAGNTITLETGLPESYSLSTAYAKYGTAVIEGNAIKYKAPEKAVPDFIDFSYNQGTILKGISRYYMNMDKGDKGDVNNDGSVSGLDVNALVDALLAGEKASNVTDIDEDGLLTIGDVTSLISELNCTAHVQPSISVTPTTIDFGRVELGTDKTKTFTVKNNGEGNLTFKIICKSSCFDVTDNEQEFTIGVGESKTYYVTGHGQPNFCSVGATIRVISDAENGNVYVDANLTGYDNIPANLSSSSIEINTDEIKRVQINNGSGSYEVISGDTNIAEACVSSSSVGGGGRYEWGNQTTNYVSVKGKAPGMTVITIKDRERGDILTLQVQVVG